MFEQEVQKQLLPNEIHYDHNIYHFSMGVIQEETVKLVVFLLEGCG